MTNATKDTQKRSQCRYNVSIIMMKGKKTTIKGAPWRDNVSFVITYDSIMTAMVGAILALAISDKEIGSSWYLPIGLLAFSMTCFIWHIEKCGEAMDENDVDKYLAWLLVYNLGTVAMFFGIAIYVIWHYHPPYVTWNYRWPYVTYANHPTPWKLAYVIDILAVIASRKWLHDIWYLLFESKTEYAKYRDELLGRRNPEKDRDAWMWLLDYFRTKQR